MARKQNQKDPSGFIFDVQSNTVMAQGGTFENMKEKIGAVRAIVPNRSNNEIILVLQHFDNCVDKTVQAFMEGNASEVLKEWTVTGKKKNKKKKTKPKPPAESSPGLPDPGKLASTEEEQSASSEKGGINGYHVNGSANDTESVDSLSEGLDTLSIDARELEDCESAAPHGPNGTAASELQNGLADLETKSSVMHSPQNPGSLRSQPEQRNTSKSLSRSTTSNQSSASLSVVVLEEVPASPANRKLGSNIEKSVKDLQRCTVSLARYRVVVKEEMDASIKKMKQAFAELQSCLMDREVALLAEMDKVKAEAMEILVSRQKKAEALKKMTDVAVRMSEEQLVELRADIKHFVSERKYDEDLGRVARFTCDLDTLKKSIGSFGQVSHPKNSYSTRSRCSSVASMSLSSPSEASAPSTPDCASASAPSLTTGSKKPPPSTDAPAAVVNSSSRPYQPQREGNRRPGQGYRPQGQRHSGPSNPGRYDHANRPRSGPGYQSSARYQNPPSRPPGSTSDLSQTHSTGANSTTPSEPRQPLPLAHLRSCPASTEAKGLPQRKPRSSQPEGAGS
ncbi:PREDICTED: spermatogenesis-associated serine-rich protein 2 isoform X1 [Gavialis gangeticus]|uniref:spermatogenesis-associated serine-rich protein 2 isoform X1 n=1 Tax=Gavialis gangeticus TaxID=94835 RepID=UPI00092F6F14|nr:PREDICTED: spermatogenesis-associated serine-rich protein 2 isoform X1 [Gavialis gangeticus]